MPEYVVKGATVWVSTAGSTAQAVNLSPYVTTVRLNYTVEMLDRTAMGSSYRRRISGLKDWSANVVFNNTSAVSAKLWTLFGSTCGFIAIKPTSASCSAGNPRYKGAVLLDSVPAIDGAIGALATMNVTFMSNGAVTKDVA